MNKMRAIWAYCLTRHFHNVAVLLSAVAAVMVVLLMLGMWPDDIVLFGLCLAAATALIVRGMTRRGRRFAVGYLVASTCFVAAALWMRADSRMRSALYDRTRVQQELRTFGNLTESYAIEGVHFPGRDLSTAFEELSRSLAGLDRQRLNRQCKMLRQNRDPWGRPFVFECWADRHEIVVRCIGANGVDDHGDDDDIQLNIVGPSGSTFPSPRDADITLTPGDIKTIHRPVILGLGGYVLTVVRSDEVAVPRTTVRLPVLPSRRAPIVLYLRLPAGRARTLMAAEGTAEFVVRDGTKRVGGQVRMTDMYVTTSPHLTGDLMYAGELWLESWDDGGRWQPKTATVSISSKAKDAGGPIEAVIMVRCTE